MNLDEAIKAEQERRRALPEPYYYWKIRGDKNAPGKQYWCDYCVGYFGVPHDMTHDDGLCSTRGMYAGNRQCACIDCVVYEQLRGSNPSGLR